MKRNKWLIIEIIAGIVLVVLIAFFVLRKLEDRRFIEEQQKLKMTMMEISEKTIEEKPFELEERETEREEEKTQKLLEEQRRIEDESSKKMFNELNAKHPAVIAIIEIPDTEIFYPIVQGEDNEFYLNHDKDGDYHPFGEVFLDFENKSDLTDANSVIYGHNIRSAKAIFNELLNYENQDYYEDHRDIKIHNKNGLSVYSIISVFKADPDDDYRKNVFNNENDFNSFLKEYNELSLVDSELIHGNKLLTLSTCFTNYDRMVIQAIKTR